MAALDKKLARLLVEFAITGDTDLRDKMMNVRAEMNRGADAAKIAGLAFSDRLASALKGATQGQAQQIIKTELARIKLKELTEQVVKYGVAVTDSILRKGHTAFLVATASAVGFATAGIRSSGIGELFSWKMEQLSRVIGGLVAPEFYKLIRLVDSFTNYLRGLDPAQKETLARWMEMAAVGLALSRMFGGWIGLLGGVMVGMGKGSEASDKLAETGQKLLAIVDRLMPALEAVAEVIAGTVGVALDALNVLLDNGAIRWIAAAGAALLFASIASKIIGALVMITSALRTLTLAKITALAFSGPLGWAQLAAGAAIAGTAIYGAVKVFDAFGDGAGRAKKKHEDLRNELARKVGGQEDFFATIARFQAASLTVGQTKPKEDTEAINRAVTRIPITRSTVKEEATDFFATIAKNTTALVSLFEHIKPPFLK